MKHLTKILLPLLLLSPIQALAQPETPKSAPPPFVLFDTNSPETEQKAADAYREGKAAQKEGRLEAARELLAQAYALNPTWKHAADLALAELALEHFRDAAEHFAFFFTHADRKTVGDSNWDALEEYFKLAKSYVAAITITVDEPGAEVLLDGKSIGFSPFISVVYADPGQHIVIAQKPDFGVTRSKIDVPAGSSPNIKLTLKPAKTPPPPPKANPPKTPSAKEPTFLGMPPWIAISIGLEFAAASAGLGYFFTTQANEYADESARLHQQLESYDRSKVPQGQPVCTHPSFAKVEECKTLPQQLDGWTSKERLAAGAFIGAGAFALGSIGLAVWKYIIPPKSEPVRTSLGLMLGTERRGVELQGRF